jgi:monoamine oxidase
VAVDCAPGSPKTIEADAAVITLPLGVLKAGAVKFDPPLTQKLDAVRDLQFGNVLKVVHVFDRQWWPDFGFIVAPEEVIPTWWTDPRGLVLTGWAGGPKADSLINYSPDEIETLGLSILERIFPSHTAAMYDSHAGAHVHNWAHDRDIRGAYSYIPVNGLDLPRLLGAPLADTLFFAGEATVTDAQTGTVFGAYESGLRAAHELIQVQEPAFAESTW